MRSRPWPLRRSKYSNSKLRSSMQIRQLRWPLHSNLCKLLHFFPKNVRIRQWWFCKSSSIMRIQLSIPLGSWQHNKQMFPSMQQRRFPLSRQGKQILCHELHLNNLSLLLYASRTKRQWIMCYLLSNSRWRSLLCLNYQLHMCDYMSLRIVWNHRQQHLHFNLHSGQQSLRRWHQPSLCSRMCSQHYLLLLCWLAYKKMCDSL